MFVGAIPLPIQQILNQHVASWTCRDIYVGCSGNFTTERVLNGHARFLLHSNDVSLYSSVIGSYLAGQPFRVELSEKGRALFGWLDQFMISPVATAATIMLSTRLRELIAADGTLARKSHYARMYEAFKRQWAALHAATVAKLEALGLKLASFAGSDMFDWIDQIPAEAGFVSFPETGKGDYQRLYKHFDVLFNWDRPAYLPLCDDRLSQFLNKLTRREFWLFGTVTPQEGLRDHLRGVVTLTNFRKPIYLYSSTEESRVIVPAQKTEPVLVPRLMPGMDIGNRISLTWMTPAQFAGLRAQYLNASIKPAPAAWPYGVLVDGLLIGAFCFSTAPNVALYQDLSCVYLLSDFPVAPTDYEKLSKLVLYAALSREGKLLAERAAKRRVRRYYTTAFSNNPVSMKYRGLFDLDVRKETDPALHPDHKYQLQYIAEAGQWSLAEALSLWKKKYGERAA